MLQHQNPPDQTVGHLCLAFFTNLLVRKSSLLLRREGAAAPRQISLTCPIPRLHLRHSTGDSCGAEWDQQETGIRTRCANLALSQLAPDAGPV